MGLRKPHKFCEGINSNMSVGVSRLLRDTQHKRRKAVVKAGFAGPKLTLLLLPLVPDRFHSKLIIIMKARSEREDLHRGSENTQTQWEERKTREMAVLWARCLLLKGVRELELLKPWSFRNYSQMQRNQEEPKKCQLLPSLLLFCPLLAVQQAQELHWLTINNKCLLRTYYRLSNFLIVT